MPEFAPLYDRSQRRSSNDGRRSLFGAMKPLIAFVCECPRPACYETILLSAAEFDVRRPDDIVIEAHREAAA